ncbi:MAG: trypsin-like peptidase domain-containing protein, partial [Proteobacteria bacterium]|nr:trypsin-like peptidase domain-containing protein [Pseudomonadota bacterium]
LMIIEESALMVTSLSCLISPEGIDQQEPVMQFIPVSLQDNEGKIITDFQIVAYHKVANLALIKIARNIGSEEKPKIPTVDVNLTRPLQSKEKLLSIRFPSAASSNDVQASTFENVLPNDIDGTSISYLIHQGIGLPNGFEGSPIVNQSGQVVGINTYSNFYFFNVGYDLASLIRQSNPQKPGVFLNFNFSNNIKKDISVIGMEGGYSAIVANDAFEETLLAHPAMQQVKFDKLLDVFDVRILSKIQHDPVMKASTSGAAKPQTRLSYFQTLDFMMDVIFEAFMDEILITKNARISDDKRSKEMNVIARKLETYFVIFQKLKKNVRLNLMTGNPFLAAYQNKIDCKFESFQYEAHKKIIMATDLRSLNVDEANVRQSCRDYVKFMKDNQKENFRLLKSEPYPSNESKNIMGLDQLYLLQ